MLDILDAAGWPDSKRPGAGNGVAACLAAAAAELLAGDKSPC